MASKNPLFGGAMTISAASARGGLSRPPEVRAAPLQRTTLGDQGRIIGSPGVSTDVMNLSFGSASGKDRGGRGSPTVDLSAVVIFGSDDEHDDTPPVLMSPGRDVSSAMEKTASFHLRGATRAQPLGTKPRSPIVTELLKPVDTTKPRSQVATPTSGGGSAARKRTAPVRFSSVAPPASTTPRTPVTRTPSVVAEASAAARRTNGSATPINVDDDDDDDDDANDDDDKDDGVHVDIDPISDHDSDHDFQPTPSRRPLVANMQGRGGSPTVPLRPSTTPRPATPPPPTRSTPRNLRSVLRLSTPTAGSASESPRMSFGDFPVYPLEEVELCGQRFTRTAESPLEVAVAPTFVAVRGLKTPSGEPKTIQIKDKSFRCLEYFRPAHTALIVVRKQDMNEYFMLVKSLYLDSDDGRQRSDQYTILLKFPSAEVGERYREKFRKGRGGDSHVLTDDLSLLENYLIRYKLQADPAKLADGVEGKAPRRSPRALSLDAPQERVVIAQPTGPPQTLFEYPHGERGAVIITTEDEWRLSDGEFLNDSLIDFGIKWTINHRADSAVLQRFQVYNTFFHRKLHELCASSEIRKRPQDELFAAMKRWVKEDIFTKDFLLIPMNESMHWFLAVVAYPNRLLERLEAKPTAWEDDDPSPQEPPRRRARIVDSDDEETPSASPATPAVRDAHPCTIYVLDSLGGLRRGVFTLLRNFICQELKRLHPELSEATVERARRMIASKTAQVPQQNNHSDCGLYMIRYIEHIVSNGETAYEVLQSDTLDNWFNDDEGRSLRAIMRSNVDACKRHYKEVVAERAQAESAPSPDGGSGSDTDEMEIITV